MSTVGTGIDRTDGPAKVAGRALYSGDVAVPGMAWGWLVLSTVARGRITAIDDARAAAMPGVLAVMSHRNAPRLPQGGKAALDPPAGRALSLLQDDRVAYNHQPVALVVAQTLEQARDAALQVRVRYAAEPPDVRFEEARGRAFMPEKAQGQESDSLRGDLAKSRATAQTQVAQRYTTPVEHHNPMEPHATLAHWDGPRLTLYDATQYVSGAAATVAKTLGIPPEQVTVICPYVGGGFGCKGSVWSHVVLAAMAAREVGRPVKLVLDRTHMFGMVGNRPHTDQQLRLDARADGRLAAVQHDVVSETSAIEDWVESSAIVTRMLYASDSQATSHRLVKLDVGTPTFMRAPGEASGSFALESSMDELAWALKMDPVALRRANHADRDHGKDKPFSSKSLLACYDAAGERFGWNRRSAMPGQMRDGHWRVGLGMATATYPTNRSAAEAQATLLLDGRAVVRSGTQDLGTGTYTVMTQVAADALGMDVGQVRFELGDSRLPKAPVSGGSQSAASVAPAVRAACEQVRDQLVNVALADRASPLFGRTPAEVVVADGWMRLRDTPSRGETLAAQLARHGKPVQATAGSRPGAEKQAYSMHSFGAVFAEVRVDDELGIVRVPRITAAYGIGRMLNAKLAHSQLMGGIVWGVAMALQEETLRDGRNGRYVNHSLADYHLPVNADIGAIEVIVVPEEEPHANPLGIKGIGEIGITGVAAAIANAVYHATGRRVRDLPITLDKLMT